MDDFSYAEPREGVLALSGELTLDGAPMLKCVLLEALSAHPQLELDLLNVTKLDTAGVQLLLLLHRESVKAGKKVSCLGYSLAAEDALELLDLAQLFGPPGAVVWG